MKEKSPKKNTKVTSSKLKLLVPKYTEEDKKKFDEMANSLVKNLNKNTK